MKECLMTLHPDSRCSNEHHPARAVPCIGVGETPEKLLGSIIVIEHRLMPESFLLESAAAPRIVATRC